jgi:drug/metabolite transporter (DMT)-like permease
MPDKISPNAVVFIRLACCTFLFWLIKFLFVKEQIKSRDLLRLALCGLLGAAANQLLFFHGINLTSPIDASIIMTITPVIVLIFSLFILKESITKPKILGISIGGIGAILLILYGNKAIGTSSFLGNLFVFLNACSYGLYLVVAKTLMKKYHTITVISWVFLFGFIYVFPFGINDVLTTNFEAFTLNTYLVLGYIVLFTTFFAYLFNVYALNYLSPSVNSSYVYLQPAVSFVIVSISAYVFLNNDYAQDINLIKIVSCLLIILGVYIISRTQKKLD